MLQGGLLLLRLPICASKGSGKIPTPTANGRDHGGHTGEGQKGDADLSLTFAQLSAYGGHTVPSVSAPLQQPGKL